MYMLAVSHSYVKCSLQKDHFENWGLSTYFFVLLSYESDLNPIRGTKDRSKGMSDRE